MSDKPKIHFDLPTGVQATDLTQVFTSEIYPVVVIDAMTTRAKLDGLRMWSPILRMDPDAFETTTSLVLELRPGVRRTNYTEAFASDATLALELRPVIKRFAYTEAFASGASLDGINLDPSVVRTSPPVEAFTTTADLDGIRLE